MSTVTQPANDHVFRRREFEEQPPENRRRWQAPEHVYAARQTALHYQRLQVQQSTFSKLAVAVYFTPG